MRARTGATQRILGVLQESYPGAITIEKLGVAAGINEWPRRIRELRAAGWRIEYSTKDRSYRLLSMTQQHTRVQGAQITAKQRYRIIARDHSRCRRCAASADDGVKLVVDHIVPRDWGGTNDDGNLWTLCEECNLGKKAWQSDADAAVMQEVLKEKSGRSRLRRYFELRPNVSIAKEELQIVAGIGEYARRIRELRQREHFNIVSNLEDRSLKPGEYRYVPVTET